MDPVLASVLTALIVAVPLTITAIAGLRQAKKTAQQAKVIEHKQDVVIDQNIEIAKKSDVAIDQNIEIAKTTDQIHSSTNSNLTKVTAELIALKERNKVLEGLLLELVRAARNGKSISA